MGDHPFFSVEPVREGSRVRWRLYTLHEKKRVLFEHDLETPQSDSDIAESLEDILADPLALRHFHQVLQRSACDENLLFYRDALCYERLALFWKKNKEVERSASPSMALTFVSPTSSETSKENDRDSPDKLPSVVSSYMAPLSTVSESCSSSQQSLHSEAPPSVELDGTDDGGYSGESLTELARFIFETYLFPDAPLKVNVSAASINKLLAKQAATDGFTFADPFIFTGVAREVYQLMYMDSVPHFLRSKEFENYRRHREHLANVGTAVDRELGWTGAIAMPIEYEFEGERTPDAPACTVDTSGGTRGSIMLTNTARKSRRSPSLSPMLMARVKSPTIRSLILRGGSDAHDDYL
ncbi:MAG: hypothetical protein MHM6MM_000463 [Cercozoa sp. M6MM]